MWKYEVPCDVVLYDVTEQVNSVKLLKVCASLNSSEVPSIYQDLVQWSLTFDIEAFGTPQTVFERPVSVNNKISVCRFTFVAVYCL